MAKNKTVYICQECGYESPKWMGRCPGCQQWNTLVEEAIRPAAPGLRQGSGPVSMPSRLTEVVLEEEPRIKTGMTELNRVLGGGVVPASLTLVGGDPGIGKSTLLLQTSDQLARGGHRVLYISGEESVRQTKMRATRLGVTSDALYVLAETDIGQIERQIEQVNPEIMIIDSIQTIYNSQLSSAPGSISQVKECTAYLLRLAKQQGIAVFIVGHVTKNGALAGPRTLEHMVDTVLYFEGERHHTFRILRAVKNRFGSTNEMGVFEMKEGGLVEVANPSEIFLQERAKGAAGSAVTASMEGTRPLLVEVQALVTPTSFGNPRRMAAGLDNHRIALLMAVLEKRVGLLLQNQDAYINVAGGVKLDEPAVDLAVAISIASSFNNRPTKVTDAFVGEIGLTGEVRRVSRIDQRINEASKLGFSRIFVPSKNLGGWSVPDGVSVIGVDSLAQAIQLALGTEREAAPEPDFFPSDF
ncbi:DNA repair protein RadA [Sporolactobacillus inulinus]|uniref:DNA repair protein RadA n=1 Tax=Sporolactobacillus inulinus CASD TaxID=1069536 RepID=A0A0U1QNV3_9BACL|nr:DNA repair protein RadA [Sporolactobacillus inulinus]KLI02488.1 DNA repair protein RadA [Sporolactobacillus inulinus CASD]GEB77076.1 DNA repair protein RadA [Sporolactobacillus inulinus]